MTSRRPKILVLDDEPDMAETLARILSGRGYEPLVETSSARALELVERERPDLVLTDLRMPGLDGMGLLERLRARRPDIPVLMLTGYASIDSAVEAMRGGAADYLAKPFKAEEILLRVERALEQSRLEAGGPALRGPVEAEEQGQDIVGQAPALLEALSLADKSAASEAPVLIVGESGTGKELLARRIHRQSPRRAAAFFAVPCGARIESQLEAELFGHEQGAFADAGEAGRSLFEAAAGGTLLLDEISETTLSFQVKLLRVIEERRFLRVGGTRPVATDVRVLAASVRGLQTALAEGCFRQDLYYRLGACEIRLPPLRERKDDIPALAMHFLERCAAQAHKRVSSIHPEALERLARYRWPGNVRELQNVLERAFILAEDGRPIRAEHLPFDPPEEAAETNGLAAGLREAERQCIVEALRACNGNRSLAARRLGIGRRTLYDKLVRLGISLAQEV